MVDPHVPAEALITWGAKKTAEGDSSVEPQSSSFEHQWFISE